MRADPSLPAIFLCLRPNKVILQSCKGPFPVRQAQPDGCSRAFGCVAAAGADFVREYGAVAPGQLHHDAPPHPITPTSCFGLAHTTPRFETVSARIGSTNENARITQDHREPHRQREWTPIARQMEYAFFHAESHRD
jgi:hypothetical protein